MTRVYLAVGSNQDAEANLAKGLQLLRQQFDVIAVSPVYESRAVADNTVYLNAAIALESGESPEQIKAALAEIEAACGRLRTDAQGRKSKQVALDFDLLLVGDSLRSYEFRQKSYRLPHADIVKDAHVAVPLSHIAATVIHPETKQSLLAIASQFDNADLKLRHDIRLSSGSDE